MDDQLTQRLLGTGIIIILAVIAIPDIKYLNNKKDSTHPITTEIISQNSDRAAFTFSQPGLTENDRSNLPTTANNNDEYRSTPNVTTLPVSNNSPQNLISQQESVIATAVDIDTKKNKSKINTTKNVSTAKQHVAEHHRSLENHTKRGEFAKKVEFSGNIVNLPDENKPAKKEEFAKKVEFSGNIVNLPDENKPVQKVLDSKVRRVPMKTPSSVVGVHTTSKHFSNIELNKTYSPLTKTMTTPKTRQTTNTPTSVVVGHYVLQENANSLRDYYIGQNIRATIDKIIVSGRDIYQVKIWR